MSGESKIIRWPCQVVLTGDGKYVFPLNRLSAAIRQALNIPVEMYPMRVVRKGA